MCVEIRAFQANADEVRRADVGRRQDAKQKEREDARAQTKAYKVRLADLEGKQHAVMQARLEDIRQSKMKMAAESEAREAVRMEDAKRMRTQDRARKKAIEEKYANRTITA